MKLVFKLLIVINIEICAQWIPLNNFPSGNSLNSVFFFDDDNGWIAGDFGTLLKFYSEAHMWKQQLVPVNSHLNTIGFFTPLNGIAGGDGGTLLRSSDGGYSWANLKLNIYADINEIDILNDLTAYAAGDSGTFLKTTNAGITWHQISIPVERDLISVDFFNDSLGLVGTGFNRNEDTTIVLRTTDGGISWSEYSFESDLPHNIYSVCFKDSLTAYLGGGYGQSSGIRIYQKTTDGGISWSQQEFPGYEIHDMVFTSDGRGIIVGGNDTYDKFLISNVNDSLSNLLFHHEDYDLNSVCITPSGKGWAVGRAGEIAFSEDYLVKWTHIFAGIPPVKAIDIAADRSQFMGFEWPNFRDPAPVFMRPYNNTFMFRDINVYMDYSDFENVPVKINMLDSANGYYLSRFGSVLKTTTGGTEWQYANYEIPFGYSGGIFFLNKDTGWAFSNEIYKTTDKGDNWQLQLTASNIIISDLFFIDPWTGYACGSDENLNGRILKTTDGGNNWTLLTSVSGQNRLTALSFINPDTGIVVGWGGSRLLTFDGGSSWISEITQKPMTEEKTIKDKDFGLSSDPTVFYQRDKSGNIKSIKAAPQDNFTDVIYLKNILFTSTDTGRLDISTDQGATWLTEFTDDPIHEIDADEIKYCMVRTATNVLLYIYESIIPVKLVSLSANLTNQAVYLNWSTSTEKNNFGFAIERKTLGEWENIGFVQGNGTTSERINYSFTDYTPGSSGTIKYRLKQFDYSGAFEYSSEVSVLILVNSYSLEQNFPNPFNPETKIRYSLPGKQMVSIKLIDALGSEIKELEKGEKEAGTYELVINSDNLQLASGVYFYILKTTDFSTTRKMILIK